MSTRVRQGAATAPATSKTLQRFSPGESNSVRNRPGGRPPRNVELSLKNSDLQTSEITDRLARATLVLLEIAQEHNGPWRSAGEDRKGEEKR